MTEGLHHQAGSDACPCQGRLENGQRRVDPAYSGCRTDEAGKAPDVAVPQGVAFSAADGSRQESRIFKVEVSSADVTGPLCEQKDVVGEVMAAIRMLLPLVDAVIDPDPASAWPGWR